MGGLFDGKIHMECLSHENYGMAVAYRVVGNSDVIFE